MSIIKEHKIENNIEKKYCPTCLSWKELNMYRMSSNSWDRKTRVCKECFGDNKNIGYCFSICSTSSLSAYEMGFNSRVFYKLFQIP